MTSKTFLVGLVAVFALVFAITSVSAYAQITAVEVNGVDIDPDTGAVIGADRIVAFAGETVDVRVQFKGLENAEDVRVKAFVSGERELQVSSGRFDVLEDGTYTRTVRVQVPYDLDENLDEEFLLEVLLDSRNKGTGDSVSVRLTVERESYVVDLLDVEMDTEVTAGNVLPIDVVLKNRGRHLAEDSFVKVSIPALGITDRGYFGDLSSNDQADPDKEDAAERRLFLKIPRGTPSGVYAVEIEAFNDDAVTKLTRKVVVGASSETIAVSAVHSKTVNVGESAEYTLTVVNTGTRVQVYELVVESGTGLMVELSEPIIAVPAGTSRTVRVHATPQESGSHSFNVNVHSGAEIVKTESYTANAEGRNVGGNATVLLTVILAIIFVVLLVVLIVLLTRSPEKSEEFGESYY